MDGSELSGKGVTGRVAVDDHFVTINRKGVLAKASHGFTKGEKRIPIDAVTAVQFKKPGMTNGYIQFTVGGGNEGTSGVMQATQDENSVVFRSSHRREFEAIRDHIEERIIKRGGGGQSAGIQAVSVAQELKTLAELRDQGVISNKEFEKQKAKLIG